MSDRHYRAIVVKTDKERKAEADALEKIKPKVRAKSFFGDDNHAAIDAQVAVIRGLLTNEQIHGRYENDYALTSALEARQWLEGEMDGSLLDEWKSLT